MSVNISVSGKTLKECHEQILAIAEELSTTGPSTRTATQTLTMQDLPKNDPAHGIEFNIKPEVASSIPTNTSTSVVQATNGSSQAGEVDSRGIPWDARIHSSNKEKSRDGIWRRRRGVDPALEAQVEAELRGAPAKKAPPFGSMTEEQYQQVVKPAPVAPMPTTEHRVALPAESQGLLNTVQVPAAPIQQTVPIGSTLESFKANIVLILNDLAAQGKIDYNWINAQKVQFQGKDIMQWHEHPEACKELHNAFITWGFIKV